MSQAKGSVREELFGEGERAEVKQILYLCLILVCSSCSSFKVKSSNQVARIPWPHSHSAVAWCEILEKRSSSAELPERELVVIDTQGHHTSMFRTPDSFVAMYPVGEEDALLITVWVGGSAYKVRVLSFMQSAPAIVLECGSKSFPEVIHSGVAGTLILFGDVTGDPAIEDNWRATRYSWDGSRISRLDEVPFSSRFANLPE